LRKQSSKDLSSIPTNPKPKQNNKKKLQLYGFFVPKTITAIFVANHNKIIIKKKLQTKKKNRKKEFFFELGKEKKKKKRLRNQIMVQDWRKDV